MIDVKKKMLERVLDMLSGLRRDVRHESTLTPAGIETQRSRRQLFAASLEAQVAKIADEEGSAPSTPRPRRSA